MKYLNRQKKYIEDRKPQVTIFEGAATSDPVPVEPYTNSFEENNRVFWKRGKRKI
uniref:Spore photoproduct lyase n=1 Tax=Clostridioides difficile TaxID=1496 RepID=A0A381I563_CLODI|nr:spore photoproduct lyase [Clostridioides difficile]